MKRLAIILCLLVAGCVSIERRPPLQKLPETITVAQTVRVLGQGISKHEWMDLPAGLYEVAFEWEGNRYYMCKGSRVILKTLAPAREYDGGICYSPRTGRFHAFFLGPGVGGIMVGTIWISTGDAGKMVPVTPYVISDDIVMTMKDEANQALQTTPRTHSEI